MHNRLRNGLRVRLTLVVTVAVGLALAGASVWLVTAMSRTLVGDVEELASAKVDSIADALRAGQPVSDEPPGYLTVIQILDEHGQVVQQIPPSPAGAPVSGDTRHDDAVVASRTVSTPDGERTVVAVSRLGPLTHGVTVVVDALLIATPLLTVFVAALTWFAVHRALRPVEAIRRRAEVISHSTLMERLPRARTGDEVARLTDTLNEMLDRIAEGARRQREFVSDASHELRTPLAAMRADLEVSLARPDAADWPALCRRLLDDHRRLDRLTGDLLTLARLDEDTDTTPEPVRLDEIVAGELPEVRRSELTVDLAPAVVLGVEPQLARLVRNLLDNADRHAASDTHVRLAVAGDTVTLTVDDNGPGILATQRHLVFDRFVRLDTSRTNATGGTGIGLAIAHRIVRNHHGTITVHTAPIGGARFEVTLSAFAKVG